MHGAALAPPPVAPWIEREWRPSRRVPMRWLVGVAVAAICAGALVFVSEFVPERSGYDFREDAVWVFRHTLPDDAVVTETTEVEVGSYSYRQSWTFSTEMSWEAYGAWLTVQLANRFATRESSQERLHYAEQTEGDLYTVIVESTDAGPPLQLRVTFSAAAW